MDLIVGLLLGIVVTVVARTLFEAFRRPRSPYMVFPEFPGDHATSDASDAAPAGGAEDGQPDPAVLRAEIYNISEQLADFYQASSQPVDLLSNELFGRGVEILGEPVFTTQKLLSYYSGDNAVIACMALEALSKREDPADILEPLLYHIPRVSAWTRYFALRALNRRVSKPFLAELFTRVGSSWEGSVPFEVLRAFLAERSPLEPDASLTPVLPEISTSRLDFLEGFLARLNVGVTERFLREIHDWRLTQVDTDELRGIGKVWGAGEDSDEDVILDEDNAIAMVSDLEASLNKEPRRSVLLVGPSGCGKSAVLRVLARRLQDADWLVFEAGAADLLAGQTFIGELEQRLKDLVRNLGGQKKVLWIIPEFHQLLWAGQHRHSPTGVLDLLLPAIESGDVVVAGETHPASYDRVIRNMPRVRISLDTFRLQPASDERTLDLAREWSRRHGASSGSPLLSDALIQEALHLSKQYLGSKVAPGNLMDLLKQTHRRLSAARPTAASVEMSIEDVLATLAQQTGLPYSILDDRKQLDLERLRRHFQKRVLGQQEAVECLIERVAMIKAGLTDPSRPQGVFFFPGPTGTGKTEIAKTLTEFLFGSAERMIRLDMSEFQLPRSVDRILGEQDYQSDSMALVHQIRNQPFSVILLDEFEKANASVWDLFLQIFDDGRLTDAGGNTADFRHAIIIMTSNLGGDVARGDIGFLGDFARAERVTKAVAEVFRKEFINRIDRIVPFRPLSRTVMRAILEKELQDVLERRGLRNRSWAVEWEDSALEFLLDRGFDAELGARPLKRAIERYLLTPLSLTIVNHQFPDGDQFLFVRGDGERLRVDFIDPDAPEATDAIVVSDKAVVEPATAPSLGDIIASATGTAAELEFLRGEYDELRSLIGNADWKQKKDHGLEQLSRSDFWSSPDRFSVLGQVEYMDRIEAGLKTAGSLLERLSRPSSLKRSTFSRDIFRRLAQQLYLIRMALTGLDSGSPQDAFVVVRSGAEVVADSSASIDSARKVGEMYRSWAKKRHMDLRVLREEDGASTGRYELVLAISGYGAYTILHPESGLHVFESDGKRAQERYARVRVQVVPQPENPVKPRPRALLQTALDLVGREPGDTQTIIRKYRELPSPLVRDSIRNWRTGRLERVLDGDFDIIAV